MNILVKRKDLVIKLRPLNKGDLPTLAEHFSSMKVHFYTKGLFAQTLENEIEWYEKNRQSRDSVHWAIVPIGDNTPDIPIGITGLHDLDSRANSCVSGIIIWDTSWWGKGVASSAHLARTLFAADYLNRWQIQSTVREENTASLRALKRVGYSVWGTDPCPVRKAGRWLPTHHLVWINPDTQNYMFPGAIPTKYQRGIKKATTALTLARNIVEFP